MLILIYLMINVLNVLFESYVIRIHFYDILIKIIISIFKEQLIFLK